MNKKAPRVSIGMPVYNGENFIEHALNSLLAQTYKDFELIISDNASTDRTEEICRAYAAKDQRIRYFRNEANIGGAANFNRAFELATGEYFRWASHDDVCAPTYLEKCVEILDREPNTVLCYPKSHRIDQNGKCKGVYTQNLNLRATSAHQRFHLFLETYGWYHATQIYGLMRREELAKTSLLGKFPHADRVLLSEISLLGEFAEVPEFLFERRVHAQTAQVANNTYETLAAWFDPKNKGKRIMPRWRRYAEYCKGVNRTDLSLYEKLLCYWQIVRRLNSNGHKAGLAVRLQGMLVDLVKAASPTLYPLVRLLLQEQPKKTEVRRA